MNCGVQQLAPIIHPEPSTCTALAITQETYINRRKQELAERWPWIMSSDRTRTMLHGIVTAYSGATQGDKIQRGSTWAYLDAVSQCFLDAVVGAYRCHTDDASIFGKRWDVSLQRFDRLDKAQWRYRLSRRTRRRWRLKAREWAMRELAGMERRWSR